MDKFSKYAQFLALVHPSTAQSVAQAYMHIYISFIHDFLKGKPGAVVRAVSLSYQVTGSKQPLRRFCEGKACLGFFLSQTSLTWESLALGLPFFSFMISRSPLLLIENKFSLVICVKNSFESLILSWIWVVDIILNLMAKQKELINV